ncbi:PE-PGRS family protein [Streptomyces sp. RS10V-4]|uniref:PE-PGRS family protein n=1 Tax=Streptomyces rhizoryzae TaxID=2932493 RepID=UPI002004D778|nr:PE-PGRS family protein [Streptomyces rhizoryzae]MCK7627801.1 PE-PGRS family protein [Streptomyces rhizoryzae]
MGPVMDAGHVLRGLRAAVFAAVCVLLAALGHAVMSDAAVPGWMLLAAGPATMAGAWFATARERGPLLVGLLTVGTQAALHSAFSLGQAVAGAGQDHASLARAWARTWLCGAQGLSVADIDAARAASPMGAMGPMPMGPMGSMGSMGSLGPMGSSAPMPHGGMPMDMHGSATGMLAAHLLVALLSAWWLWGGERAAFRLVRCVSAWLFAPLVLVLRAVLPTVRPARRPARQEPRCAVRQLLLAHAMSLRGPPRGPAVV